MLQSPVRLAVLRLPLAMHFLRHLGELPWAIVAAGQRRSCSPATAAKLEQWAADAHARRLGVAAILPDTGGHLWHLAARGSPGASRCRCCRPSRPLIAWLMASCARLA